MLSKITRIGGHGLIGGVVAAVIIELGTQAILKFAPPIIQQKVNADLPFDAPFLGKVDIRDAAVLSPTILNIIKFIKGQKADVMMMIGNYGAKVIMRQTGINPHGLSHQAATPQTNTETNIIATELPEFG